MAINQLIAQGIAPIGRDLPQIGQMLQQKKQQEQQNALAQMASQTDQQNVTLRGREFDIQAKAAQRKQAQEWLAANYERVRNTEGALQKGIAYGKQQGFLRPDLPETATLEDVAMDLGVAAPAAPVTLSSERVGGFNVLRDSTGKVINSQAPERSSAAAPRPQVRTLTAQEAEAMGFPKGSVIQQNSDGAFKPVYKPPNASVGADAKLRKEAATRLPQLAALDRRMERLTAAVAAISDNPIFSGGVVSEKVLPYTKEGRELNASIAQVKPILTALTRVPGIGSQSDLEARLDSLQYPDAGFSPETNEANAAEITAFIADLSAAYQSLLSGGAQAAAGSGEWSVEEAE